MQSEIFHMNFPFVSFVIDCSARLCKLSAMFTQITLKIFLEPILIERHLQKEFSLQINFPHTHKILFVNFALEMPQNFPWVETPIVVNNAFTLWMSPFNYVIKKARIFFNFRDKENNELVFMRWKMREFFFFMKMKIMLSRLSHEYYKKSRSQLSLLNCLALVSYHYVNSAQERWDKVHVYLKIRGRIVRQSCLVMHISRNFRSSSFIHCWLSRRKKVMKIFLKLFLNAFVCGKESKNSLTTEVSNSLSKFN